MQKRRVRKWIENCKDAKKALLPKERKIALNNIPGSRAEYMAGVKRKVFRPLYVWVRVVL